MESLTVIQSGTVPVENLRNSVLRSMLYRLEDLMETVIIISRDPVPPEFEYIIIYVTGSVLQTHSVESDAEKITILNYSKNYYFTLISLTCLEYFRLMLIRLSHRLTFDQHYIKSLDPRSPVSRHTFTPENLKYT